MIDPNTPLEQIAEMCRTPEDLSNLLKQCDFKTNTEDNIQISQELLQEAIAKIGHLKIVTRSDIQRLLLVGYPLAARIYESVINTQSNIMPKISERTRILPADVDF